MLEVTITNEQKILVTLNPVTATGTQAKLDGDPVWTQTSGLSTVEVDEENPLQAYLVSSDTPGESRFVVEADADLGEGVTWLADGIKLIVEGSRAVSLGLKTGEAVSKTPAEPPPAPAKK